MVDTSFCRLALSGHFLRPLCRPNDSNDGLDEARLIRDTLQVDIYAFRPGEILGTILLGTRANTAKEKGC